MPLTYPLPRRLAALTALLLSLLFAVASAAPEPGRHYRLLALDSQRGSPYDEVRSALFEAIAGWASGRDGLAKE